LFATFILFLIQFSTVAGINNSYNNFAGGSRITDISTKYGQKFQTAVNVYINSEDNYYNLITNNCADFVNDTINAADDVDISDKTISVVYYK